MDSFAIRALFSIIVLAIDVVFIQCDTAQGQRYGHEIFLAIGSTYIFIPFQTTLWAVW